MAHVREQFTAARKAATRLGLADARERRSCRSQPDLIYTILPGATVPSDLQEKLFNAYTSVYEPLSKVGGYRDS